VFDVYVDGATGTSREAVHELASAMAARYRLPAAELEARLTRGRFRVKAGVDRSLAEAYLRDLAAIGARVRIEPAGELAAGAPGPRPESRPARSSLPRQSEEPRLARSSLPPQPESRPARSSLPAQAEARPARSSLPRQSEEPRPARSSLPPQPESRPARSSLPAQAEARPARSSLPRQPEEPRPARSLLPPQPESRPARSSLPPPEPGLMRSSQPPPAEDEESSLVLSLLPQPAGWSPAGSSGSPAEDGVRAATGQMATLGALDRSGALSLATLDNESTPLPATDGTLPASMGPAAPRPARSARSRSEPVDPFAPPELAADEALRELADDDLVHRARGQASASPAMAAEPARPATPSSPTAGPQRALPTLSGAPVSPDAPRISDAPQSALGIAARRLGSELRARIPALASARVRLVAGVALAIALGFVPAHLVAGMRERSAFAAIDAKVAAVQSTADTPDSYAALDAFRAEQLEAKYSARRSIAVTSLLVWAAVGAALAYGWFSLFRSGSVAPAAPRPVRVLPGGARDSFGG
jgi:hypothetical protein